MALNGFKVAMGSFKVALNGFKVAMGRFKVALNGFKVPMGRFKVAFSFHVSFNWRHSIFIRSTAPRCDL